MIYVIFKRNVTSSYAFARGQWRIQQPLSYRQRCGQLQRQNRPSLNDKWLASEIHPAQMDTVKESEI